MLGFKPTRLDQTASNVTLQADMPWIMHRITNIPLTFSNLPTALYIIINNVGHWPILLSHVHHSIMHSRALDPSHSSNQTECPEQNLSTASWASLISSQKGPINMWVFFLILRWVSRLSGGSGWCVLFLPFSYPATREKPRGIGFFQLLFEKL